MPRYIDANKLKTRIAPESDFRNTLSEWIDLQETEDVAPAIHAHWFESYWGGIGAECSNCGDVVSACDMDYQDVIHDFEYCPYCGAKMDEEVE